MAYTGSSIVDYLNSVGKASDYNTRAKLAAQYGISNYSGSSSQNTQLLNAMRGGSSSSSSKTTTTPAKTSSSSSSSSSKSSSSSSSKSSTYTGSSLVDYLSSVGQSSNYSSREKLAAQYGINNYTGSSSQNTQLLNALRSGQAPKSSSTPTQPLTPTKTNTPTPTPTPTKTTTSAYDTLIKNNPVLAEQLKDPAVKAQFDSLPEDLQAIYLQTASALGKAIESGKVVNPNIKITAAENRKLLKQAETEIEPYYKEKFDLLKNDFETSISRLLGDVGKSAERANESFGLQLGNEAESEAQSGTTFSSGRVDRKNRSITLEQNALDDMTEGANRNAQDLATAYEKQAGSDNLRSLNIPGLTTYRASDAGVGAGGSRSLYAPLGNIKLGEINKQKEVDTATRKSELESAFRSNRILDLSKLS